ncbi:uncharacterized protein LOC131639578 [Vicia villosa]|uniref:uncharacterized protein LOC131639578 n=1 Tax=Vicia villosa TaxID=3911 RepID=UPI00273CEA3C|nr:uncharacterized protein LOC131639578 [Vicia villosa]
MKRKIRRKKTSAKSDFYLPDDCWEHVFTFLNNHNRDFNSLSLVSKRFLSITNTLLFSLRIRYPRLCFLRRILHRFYNLNFLDLRFNLHHDLGADIALALRNIPTLKSLAISNINLKYGKYVTSLFIDSLLSLKGLISLKFRCSQFSNDLFYSIGREGLPLKSFVIKYCTGYTYDGVYFLLSKCHTIQHLGLRANYFLDNHHITDLSLLLPHLVSINLSQCFKLTESALFAIISNCHSIEEIIMEEIDFGNFDSFKNFQVSSQLKSLCLADNSSINDESIITVASIFPNLQLLDLNGCDDISEKGICHVLSRCCKIRYLNLSDCCEIRLLEMNFVVPQLEVLNLSYTRVDDKTLYEISKSCHGLLQLKLAYCNYVTEKGMIHVVENCTQLKEIDLRNCKKVEADVIVSKVLSRSPFKKRNLFSRDEHIFFS